MYFNGKSLNVALFILMGNHLSSRVTLQLLGVKIFHVELPLYKYIQLKQKDWGKSNFLFASLEILYFKMGSAFKERFCSHRRYFFFKSLVLSKREVKFKWYTSHESVSIVKLYTNKNGICATVYMPS